MPPKSRQAKKTSLASTNAGKALTKPETRPPPNWPVFGHLLPASDLSLVPLLQDQILTIPSFWTVGVCKAYVNFLSSLPLVTTPGKPKKGEAVRVNDRYQIDDPAFAEMLWSGTALKDLVEHPVIDGRELSKPDASTLWGGEVLGLNSNIRIYRYSKGQFFDQHYDDSNNVVHNGIPAKTTWTLLLYLTSPTTGCYGGETVFYPEAATKRDAPPPPVIAELDVGMALLHRHGRDCLLHEGREVTDGEKWVIRSDLCVKR